MSWIAVRLRQAGPLYHARLEDEAPELHVLQRVLVEGERVHDLATVVQVPVELRELPNQPLRVLRTATAADLARESQMQERSRVAIKMAKLEVRELGLDMKISEARYSLDGQHLAIWFLAEDRVDFRELVRRLASRLACRVELRQVSPREEARQTGGVGPCGEMLCCATWLTDFEPVSVRAAKEQCLSMSGDKLTGVCGKLKCCLNYEVHMYRDLRKGLPKPKQFVRTGDGWARVIAIDILKQSVVALSEDGARWNVKRDEILEIARQPGGSPESGRGGEGGRERRSDRRRDAAPQAAEPADDPDAEGPDEEAGVAVGDSDD